MANLGRAVGTIDFKFNGDDAVKKAQKGLDDISGSSEETEDALTKVGNTAGIAGLSIVGGLGLAIKSAADFEKGLSAIQAVSGSTVNEMEAVRQKALDIGADTAFSATEASSAIEELVKAGVSIPDVMNGAADATVALAAAGEIALPEAATIASNAMNQFGLAAKDLPRVADLIAGAANASAIDVGQFGYALSQVGAVANLAGLSFDDTSVAIAELGNAGIVGSDAGTSLKSMLMNLQPSTKKAAQQMEALGLLTEEGGNAFYDAEGKTKSLAEIQDVLGNSLKGLSNETKTAALETLFGSDAIRAAAVLADAGAAGYNDMAASMGKVSAADVAATRLNNLSGQIEMLKGSVETVAIKLGTLMLPALNKATEYVGMLVDKFGALDPATQKMIVQITAAVAGFLIVGSTIIKTVMFVQAGIEAFMALKTAFLGLSVLVKIMPWIKGTIWLIRGLTLALVTNPIFLVIAAVVLLGVALWAFFTKTAIGRKIIAAVWAGIKTAIAATVDWVMGTAVPALIAAWDWIVNGAKSLWSGIVSIFKAIGSFLQMVAGLYIAYVMFWVNGILAVINWFKNAAMTVWAGFWYLFGDLIKAVWGLIVAIVMFYVNTMVAVVTAVMGALVAAWTASWNFVSGIVTAVWGWIVNAVTTAWNWLVGILQAGLSTLQGWWAVAWAAVSALFEAVWNRIVAFLTPIIEKIKAIIAAVVDRVQADFQQFKVAVAIAVLAFELLRQAVADKLNAVRDKISAIVAVIKGIFNGAKNWLFDAGKAIITGLIDGIKAMAGALADKLTSITKMIPKKKGPPAKDRVLLQDNGELIMKGLIRGVENQIPALSRLLGNVGATMPISLTSSGAASAASNARTASLGASTTSSSAAPAVAGSLIGVQNVYNPIAAPAAQTAQAEARKRAMVPTL